MKKMDWYYDGESWVYASEQPEMKPAKPPEEWPEVMIVVKYFLK